MILTRQVVKELTKDGLVDLINNFTGELLEKLSQPKIHISSSQVIFDPEEAYEFVESRKLQLDKGSDRSADNKRYIKEGKNFGCDGIAYIPKREKLWIEDREIISRVAGAHRAIYSFIFDKFISMYRFDCSARYLITYSNYPKMPSNFKSLFDCISHLQEISWDVKNICREFKIDPEKSKKTEEESVDEYINKLRRNVGGGVKYDVDWKTVVPEDLDGMSLFLNFYKQANGDTKLLNNFIKGVISKFLQLPM